MNINNFNIDTSDMVNASTTRRLSVYGDVGAEFEVFILEASAVKFYNFVNKEFAVGHTSSQNNLRVKLKAKKYSTNILFPQGGGSYILKLIALEDTNIQNSSTNILTKNITKLSADSTITFTSETVNTSNYTTFPTTTSTGPINSSSVVNFDWDITNVSNDSHGFGLRLTGPWKNIHDKYWYTKATTTVNGAISSSEELVVADATGIGIGTRLVSGSGLSGTPTVLAVDESNNTLTLSTVQSLSHGVSLTFRAIGETAIKEATGLDLTFTLYPRVAGDFVTKTVRAGGSGTTVNLNGTYGIAGGNHISILGVGVDNSSANNVTSVSASSTAGSIVVQNSQTLTTGIVLTFQPCYQTINFNGDVTINSFPSSNQTVYFDIDSIITVGAAS